MHLKAWKKNIMVLPADKGHPSVVMDTNTYQATVSMLIENRLYQLLNKDSTDRLTHKLSKKAAYLEATWVSIRGHLQDQTLTQTAA